MTEIIAEDNSLVVREGSLDRLRVPTGMIAAVGASFDDGDGIHWQVQDFGPQGKLLVGTVVKNARSREDFQRKPPTPPQRAATPAGGAAKPPKKGGAKKGAAVVPLGGAAVPVGVGSQFVDDDDEFNDGPIEDDVPSVAAVPLPAKTVAPVARPAVAPAPVAAPTTAVAPVPKGGGKKGGGAKKGAVAYQIPGQPVPAALGSLGSLFN